MAKHRFGIARSIRVYDIFETDDPALPEIARKLEEGGIVGSPSYPNPDLAALLAAADKATPVRRDLGEEADDPDYDVFVPEY